MAYHTRCTILKETAKAFQIHQKIGRAEVTDWIPKSLMTSVKRQTAPNGTDEELSFSIPDWLSDDEVKKERAEEIWQEAMDALQNISCG